jgi:hypothetical protein
MGCSRLHNSLPFLTHSMQGEHMWDKVWFTYKARIQAHERLSWLDRHSQILLIWYAIIGAILSVITIRYPEIIGHNTDIFSSIMSILLLGVSLTVTNLDFRGRSISMRENYLSLQHLYDSSNRTNPPSQSDIDKYHELLRKVENHKEIDDKSFRVSSYKSLTNRKPFVGEFIEVFLWKSTRATIIITLYIVPVLIFTLSL